jgi:hypothetical protein
VRIYELYGKVVDIRTGMISTSSSAPFLLSSLPLPKEIVEA